MRLIILDRNPTLKTLKMTCNLTLSLPKLDTSATSDISFNQIIIYLELVDSNLVVILSSCTVYLAFSANYLKKLKCFIGFLSKFSVLYRNIFYVTWMKNISELSISITVLTALTHFSPVSHFYIPRKTFGFLTFSGVIEM